MTVRRIAGFRLAAGLALGLLVGAGGGLGHAKTLKVAINGFENNLTPFTLTF